VPFILRRTAVCTVAWFLWCFLTLLGQFCVLCCAVFHVTQVALPHEIQELPDSSLAPGVVPNTRVLFVSAVGEHPQPASILAMQTGAW
jgi:hypothetical protein